MISAARFVYRQTIQDGPLVVASARFQPLRK
jgi:hypothetical protein